MKRRIIETVVTFGAVLALLLGMSGIAWASYGNDVTWLGLGGSSQGSQPGASLPGDGGGNGGGSVGGGGASTHNPPPPPPKWVYKQPAGSHHAIYVRNPVCISGKVKCNNNIPPSACQKLYFSPGGFGNASGGETMFLCPVAKPSPSTNLPGVLYGWSADPVSVYVTQWQVNYGGHTYTYGGSPNLDTGWTIPVVCDGAPTSGTVSYFINTPSVPPPPPGWSPGYGPNSPWSPPSPPPSGPYTSSFTVPACPSGPLTPKLVPGPGPDLENNDAVDANGNFFTFWVHPVPSKQGYQLINSNRGMVCFDNGYATVGPSSYSPWVNAFDGQERYPRWQFSTRQHVTSYSIVQYTYRDPQLLVQNDNYCGPVTNHDYSDSPNVGVDMSFHAPTNLHQPLQVTIHARYTSYWGVWFLQVQASSSSTQNSVTEPLWQYETSDYPCHHHKKITICCCHVTVNTSSGTFYVPAYQDPSAEASSLPLETAHKSYDLSKTLKIAVVAPTSVQSNLP